MRKLKEIFKYLFLAICMISIYQWHRNSTLNVKLKEIEYVSNRNYNNLLAARDSIRFEKNKNQEIVNKISSYEFEINTISANNQKLIDSYQRTLNLDSKLESISSLLSTSLTFNDSILNATTNIDQQSADSIQIELSDRKEWDKYNWMEFKGDITLTKYNDLFEVSQSTFNIERGMSLKAAILKINGRNELRISTPNPNVRFTQIENINLVNDKLNPYLKRPKNWGIGVGFQYGFNLTGNTLNAAPNVGIGIFYTPGWLRF